MISFISVNNITSNNTTAYENKEIEINISKKSCFTKNKLLIIIISIIIGAIVIAVIIMIIVSFIIGHAIFS